MKSRLPQLAAHLIGALLIPSQLCGVWEQQLNQFPVPCSFSTRLKSVLQFRSDTCMGINSTADTTSNCAFWWINPPVTSSLGLDNSEVHVSVHFLEFISKIKLQLSDTKTWLKIHPIFVSLSILYANCPCPYCIYWDSLLNNLSALEFLFYTLK